MNRKNIFNFISKIRRSTLRLVVNNMHSILFFFLTILVGDHIFCFSLMQIDQLCDLQYPFNKHANTDIYSDTHGNKINFLFERYKR